MNYISILLFCFSMCVFAEDITIFGFGKSCRTYNLKYGQSIRDVWDNLYPINGVIYGKDLQDATYYSKYVTIYRQGTIFVIDMFKCDFVSFPLQAGDLLLFSKTPLFFASYKANVKFKKTTLPPECIYPANIQSISDICDFLLSYTKNDDYESPTNEYLEFYKKIKNELKQGFAHKNLIFYSYEQMNMYKNNGVRDLSYDTIITCITRDFPNWSDSYEIHLLSPYCVRMIDKESGTTNCYGLYNNTLIQTSNHLNWYYNSRLTEASYEKIDLIPSKCVNMLISMKLYLGKDEIVLSILNKNNEVHVSIMSSLGNDIYILKHGFPPCRTNQFSH